MVWKIRASGNCRQRRTTGMNQTESDYSALLDWRQRAGEIFWHRPQCIGLRLADEDKLFYYPDELVMLPNGLLEVHEVKGNWEDDALVKIKVAADRFPFTFRSFEKIPKKHGGGWKERVFGGVE